MSADHSAKSSACCFCRDLNRQDEPLLLQREGFVNKICRDSEHFAVFPSLSPLCEGHSLVVPKYHVTNTHDSPRTHHIELVTFLQSVADDLAAALGNVVLFEHGVPPGHPGGCGVQHAHIHLLPAAPAVTRSIERRLRKELNVKVMPDFGSFLDEESVASPYLVFGGIRARVNVASTADVPSQFMRRLVAEAAGFEHWDWREYFGWKAFEATRALLLNEAVAGV